MIQRLSFFKRFDVLLTVIILLAAIVRFAYLGLLPPLLLQDEANIGFNAISIAETGKDEWGIAYPLTFKSFGDSKQPIYIYATALTYKLIGWKPYLPRVPSALAGTLSVLLIAVWLRKVTRSDATALITALIFALSPWTVHLSRLALEANLGLTFFLGGLTALEYCQNKHRWRWLSLAAVCFALSAYTYIAYRFLVIVWLFIYACSDYIWGNHKKLLSWRKLVSSNSVCILVITGLLLLPTVFLTGNFTRLSQTSLVTKDSVSSNVYQYQGSCFLLANSLHVSILSKVCRVIWNEKTEPIHLVTQNLLSHLSPQFLFFSGDSTFNRNPTKSGMLYWYLLPLYLAGIIIALKNIRKNLLVLTGLLVSLVPSVLTGEPHFIRLSIHLPFVIFLIAIGLEWFLQKFSWLKVVLPVVLCLSFGFFALTYSIEVFANSQEFLAHAQDASTTAYDYWRKGKTVYFDLDLIPEPQSYIAYWNKMNPSEYQSLVSTVLNDNQGFVRPAKLGNKLLFQEGDYKKIFCDPNSKDLVLISHHNPTPFLPTKTIYNQTKVYQFAYVFDIDDIKPQATASAAFCVPQGKKAGY